MKKTVQTNPFTLALAAGTALALTASSMALPPQPLANINPGAPVLSGGSFPAYFTRFTNSLAYFVADAPTTGTEVYRTDGTTAGTSLVKDTNAGDQDGVFTIQIATGVLVPFTRFASVGPTTTAFLGNSDTAGFELSITDGTPAGTFIIDVNPGLNFGITGGSNGVLFGTNTSGLDVAIETINGKAYFGCQDGVNGTTLWVTDGTVAGTKQVTGAQGLNVNPANNNAQPRMYTNIGNGRLLFSAEDGFNANEWFVYDTTVAAAYNAPTSAAGAASNAIGNPKRISNLNGSADGATFWIQPLSVTTSSGQVLYLNMVNTAGVDTHLYAFPMSGYNPAVDQTPLLVQATNVPGATPLRVQFDAQFIDNGAAARRVAFISNDGVNGTRLWLHDPEAALPNATIATLGTGGVSATFPRLGRVVSDGSRQRLLYWAGSTTRNWEICATDGITVGTVAAGGNGDPMILERGPGTASGAGQFLPAAINPNPATSVQSLWPAPIYNVAEPTGSAITGFFGATSLGTASGVTAPFGAANGPGQTNGANSFTSTAVQLYRSQGTVGTTPLSPVAITNPLGGPLTAGSNALPFFVTRLNPTTILYSGFIPANGREPLRTDGLTQANTSLITDIFTSFQGSFPDLFTDLPGSNDFSSNSLTKLYQNRVFFTASEPTRTRELYSTVAGTGDDGSGGAAVDQAIVADLETLNDNTNNPVGSNPGYLTPVPTASGWRLFFGATTTPSGSTTAGTGYEVYSLASDGSTGGTPTLTGDLFPAAGNGFPVVDGGNLRFAVDGAFTYVGTDFVDARFLFLGSRSVDVTLDPAALGREPYVTDGGAPTLLKDINPGAGPSLGWSTANATNILSGAGAGNGNSVAPAFRASDGKVYFAAVDGTTSSDQVPSASSNVGVPYVTDGTAAGTLPLPGTINTAPAGSGPNQFAELPASATFPQGAIIFYANDGLTGREPWVFDRAAGTVAQIFDINPVIGANSDDAGGFTVIGDRAYFVADDGAGTVGGGTASDETWVTDGTAAGTFLLADINPAPNAASFPGPYWAVQGPESSFGGPVPTYLVFNANDGASGFEYWIYDPSAPIGPSNPQRTADLNPGLNDGTTGAEAISGDPIGKMGDFLYFSGNNGVTGVEPWRFRGPDAGGSTNTIGVYPDVTAFEQLGDLNPGIASSNPSTFFGSDTAHAQIVYFSAFGAGGIGEEPHFFIAKCGPADITYVGGGFDSGNPLATYPPDGQVTIEDFLGFLAAFGDGTGCAGTPRCNPADITGAGGFPVEPDGDLTIEDFLGFLTAFGDGCP